MNSERAIIGAILANNHAFDAIDLKPGYFQHYGELFAVISKEITQGKSVDPISLSELIAYGDLGHEFGLKELTELAFDACPIASLPRHAELVREAYGKNLIRQVCFSAMNQVQEGSTFEETVNFIAGSLIDLELTSKRGAVDITEILGPYLDVIEKRTDGDVVKFSTGLTALDEQLGGGLEAGQLVIVAARPGMGKSAFSLGLARSTEKPIYIVNMEMENMQTAERFVSNIGSAPLGWLRNPTDHTENWQRLSGAIAKLSEQKNRIFLDDCPSQSLFSIRAEARRIQRKHGLGCIVIDYLSLMTGSDAKERHNQVAEFSMGLKRLAKELGVPVVALAQLSRKVEERADKRPIMSDLRESGQIEQDADIIIFIYRDEVYNKETTWKGVAELIIAKQRQGDTGTVNCLFKGQYTRFDDLPMDWVAPTPVEVPKRSRSHG